MKKVISLFLFLTTICALTCSAQKLNVEFITPSIVRVQWSPGADLKDNGTGVCVYPKTDVKVEKSEKGNDVFLASSELKVGYNKTTGHVYFIDVKTGSIILDQPADGLSAEPVVQERIVFDEKSAHTENTANGQVTVKDVIRRDTIGVSTRYKVHFYSEGEKALYGLGAHMEDYMNLQGKTMYLTQHNLKATVPMLCSTNGYGLLFDAGCAMKYNGDEKDICNHATSQKHYHYSMLLEAAKSLNYYFIKGATLDKVISGYRYLTGAVSLMPRYVFGYTQSKERYVSSDDLMKTLKEYRDRHVPIDMIVQDWNYWPEGWGYMKMNPKYYPDPKALADSIHAMNAKLMVSIWPNPQWCPEATDFKSRGMMLEHDVYDVFNPEARRHYWKYANDEFFSRGFDAWWCDSSEPLDGDWNQLPKPVNGVQYSWDCHARRYELNKDVLSDALGAERSNLYSLYHSMGIYENQRATTSSKRVVNLTRSTYAGQQRFGTVVWNGDTHASWESFKQQIPAGLNYMATGNPYWTVDVGSFFTRNNNRSWFYKGEFPQGVQDDNYKEYYVRMFQWGTFLPMLRSHGSDTPREIWRFGERGTQYYDAILKMINLRYEHVPYLYSLAAQQTFHDYTMARLLAFDFADDEQVLDIKDEYMFGDYLVCPVTDAKATTRKVYLPKGTSWYDYWTGVKVDGGQWVNASCPIDKLPVFVKAGAIIPTTEVAEYTDAQVGKPITVNVYPGADAEFTLYEDEGDNYNFENGKCSTIDISWHESTKTITIYAPKGEFDGMQIKRTFIVKTPNGMKKINYKGKKVSKKI